MMKVGNDRAAMLIDRTRPDRVGPTSRHDCSSRSQTIATLIQRVCQR